MAWLDRAGNLLAPLIRLRVRRSLLAIAAAIALLTGWSMVDRQASDATEEQPELSNLLEAASLAEPWPQDATGVTPVNYLETVGFTFDGGDARPGDAPCKSACAAACDTAIEELPRERHKRPDYVVDSPDVLSVAVRSYEADEALLESINGDHLVEADGSLNLCQQLGNIPVAGMTLAELPAHIQDCLQTELPDAQVSVSVTAQNSKVYYVITEGDDDQIARKAALGGEHVRDALAGFPDTDWSEKNVWISRPAPGSDGADQVMEINAPEVVADADSPTNYALEPGDRVFIANPPDFWDTLGDIMSTTWETLIEMFW